MFEHHENIEHSSEWSLCHSWKWQQLVHVEQVSKAVGSHALHWLIGIPVAHWFTTGSRVAIHIYIILYNQQLINQILEKVHLGNKLHVVSMSCCKFSSTKVESDVLKKLLAVGCRGDVPNVEVNWGQQNGNIHQHSFKLRVLRGFNL